jgi:ribosomal protein L29
MTASFCLGKASPTPFKFATATDQLMKNKKSEELEQQLDTLREQQANLVATDQGDSPQAQALARQIMAVASQLGFDADEAAEIAAKIDVTCHRARPCDGRRIQSAAGLR